MPRLPTSTRTFSKRSRTSAGSSPAAAQPVIASGTKDCTSFCVTTTARDAPPCGPPATEMPGSSSEGCADGVTLGRDRFREVLAVDRPVAVHIRIEEGARFSFVGVDVVGVGTDGGIGTGHHPIAVGVP